jgi:flagellin-like hook-associated protein FlgL
MAEKNLLVNEAVELTYQAPNRETGLVGVLAEIYLPTGQKDAVNFPDVELVEVGATGIYTGIFTPDAVGDWLAIYHDAEGDGQVFKRYSVGAYNVSSVGAAVNTVDGKIVTVSSAVTTVDGKVDTATGKIDTVDGKIVTVDGKVDTANTKLDFLSTKVGSLSTPPMCS